MKFNLLMVVIVTTLVLFVTIYYSFTSGFAWWLWYLAVGAMFGMNILAKDPAMTIGERAPALNSAFFYFIYVFGWAFVMTVMAYSTAFRSMMTPAGVLLAMSRDPIDLDEDLYD
jgi:hypothetical protein